MRVARWGNSLAVRLPAKLAQLLGVKEGDEVSVETAGKGRLVLRFGAPAGTSAEELLARLRNIRTKFAADFKSDREEANKRL